MDGDLERQLRELLDRQAIWNVLVRYGRGLDRVDNAMARSCYWPDAIEDHGRFVGTPEAFIPWADQVTLAFQSTTHNVMNHWCDLDGDEAHAETYYMFVGVAEKAPHLMSTGRYVDHFRKRDGEWRIANRVTVVDGTYALDDHAAAALPSPYQPGEHPATRDRNDVSYQRPLRPRPIPPK